MTLVKTVEEKLKKLEAGAELVELDGALAEAERMADQFSDVKPETYSVPIERYAGIPVFRQEKQ